MYIFLLVFIANSKFTPQTAHDMYIYTKIAVCSKDSIEQWECGYFCDLLPNMENVKVFESTAYSALAYIGVNNNRTIVSFRSTQNIYNFINDLKFIKSHYPCENCKVHTGFLETYVDLKEALLEYASQWNQPIEIVGHSLGGALAILASIDLTLKGLNVEKLYIFGTPRLGNKAFSDYFNQIVKTEEKYRITHNQDIVPHLPPQSLDYQHCIPEFWFNSDFKSFIQCTQTEDEKCSNSIWSKSLSDHQTYFNIDYKCNDKKYLQLTEQEIIL